MAAGRAAYAAIAANPDAPSFANTIGAMEQADALLDRVAGVFFNLASSDSTPAREALQRDLSPKLSAYSSEIINNRALFARIAALWEGRDGLGLTPEEARVLMLYRRMFLRAGAALEGDDAARLTEVKSRLASLGTSFTQNLLADERDWMMPLNDLAGLPDFVVASARAAAEERGQAGYVVTLNRSLIVPFLQFSRRARAVDAGLGTRPRQGAGRCRHIGSDVARRWPPRPAGAVGLALLRGKAAQICA